MTIGLAALRGFHPEATTSAVARGIDTLVADFKKHMSDVHTKVDATQDDWKGDAARAANERALGERLAGNKLATELEDIATAYRTHGSAMDGFRNAAVKAADDYLYQGLNVADDGTVTVPAGKKEVPGPVPGMTIPMSEEQLATYAVEGTTRIKGLIGQFVAEDIKLAQAAGQELVDMIQKANGEYGLGPQDPSKYGKSGTDDGKALAEALRTNDTATINEILANMPDNALSDADKEALANGKEIAVPAELRDYYKSLYQDLGKDGLLSLGTYLDTQNQPGLSTAPAAAAAQTTLASGLMMVSNERIGTGFDNGKLIGAGDYNQLPAGIRNVVSGRLGDGDWGKIAPQGPYDFQNRLKDKVGLADLMSHADSGIQPGTTLGTELGRQGADLAAYVDGKDAHVNQWTNQWWNQAMPDGSIDTEGFFREPDKDTLDATAQKYMDLGTSNPEAAYQLLTGKNSHTGEPLPADLSFGAGGAEYQPSGNYDPSKFTSSVFSHEWEDEGSAASGLYSWVGEQTHEPGRMGDLARDAYLELPEVFAPRDESGMLVAKDGKSVFESNAENFIKNPELATGLSKTLAPNLDSIAGHHETSGITNGIASVSNEDAERLLFLGAHSPDGQLYLETARQTFDLAVINQIANGQDTTPLDTAAMIGGLDARIDNALYNAATNLDVSEASDKFTHANEIYETKQKAAEFATTLISGGTDQAVERLPGGAIVHGIVGEMRDKGMESVVEKWNPEPDPQPVQFPNVETLQGRAWENFRTQLDTANSAGGSQLPTVITDQYRRDYSGAYNDLDTGFAGNPDRLKQFLAGNTAYIGDSGKAGK
ncbi:WXG100 family type VII secretion target [Nocardia sp. NPDC060249]|uniref:WXG100 family type VII secretion target n=1 Tax=Nocardia sp. NPDC060249 TaxID=3347082 RepID=UPI0036603A58